MGKIVHQSQALKRMEYLPNVLYEAKKFGSPLNNLAVSPLEAKFIRIPLDIYESAPEDASM